jgi:hypothetical protein
MRSLLFALALTSPCMFALGCGDTDKDDDSAADDTASDTDDNPDSDCTDAPSDAPTADAITTGGSGVACYYPPPEGYCREIASATAAQQVEGGDKAAIGCADAIVVTDGACPTDKAVGRCVNWSSEETRYYYTCNQYDALFAGGPQEACESVGATWEAL